MCTLVPVGLVVVVIAMEYSKKRSFVTSPNSDHGAGTAETVLCLRVGKA